MIRVAIVGYGNLGRGAEKALALAPDMRLAGVFTRRDPNTIGTAAPCYPYDTLQEHVDTIDVCIVCGSSSHDLKAQVPEVAARFHTVDSFDTHARASEYLALVDSAARPHGHVAIVAAGWDPGLFSLNRVMMEAVLPQGDTQTFWGRGISQGHGAAVREVPGVQDAVQYTIPKSDALQKARTGQGTALTTRDKHGRLCYVVAKAGADRTDIERRIKTMPHYFDAYDTQVVFVTQQELNLTHKAMPHAGHVIRTGHTTPDHKQVMEYALTLDFNPEFTASVLVACARAAYRMAQQGMAGAYTLLDVPPVLLSPTPREELIQGLL